MTRKKNSNTPKNPSRTSKGKGYIDLSQGVINSKGRQDLEEIAKVLADINLDSLDDTQREELHEFINILAIERARESFYAYVQIMAPKIIPGSKFIYGKHIEMIANDLQSVFESIEAPRPTERSQYFLPPRAMKSVLCSILFPTWVLGKRPDYSIITVGNSTKFAEDRFGRNVRMILQMDEYKTIFPETILRSDAKSAGRFVTTKGGEYFATGVGSALAGRGAHLTICGKNNNKVFTLRKGETRLDELLVGDKVYSEKGYQTVSRLVDCRHKLVYTFNSDIEVSPEHPLYLTKNKHYEGWVEAQELRVGHKIKVGTIWNKIKAKLLRILRGKQCEEDVVIQAENSLESIILKKG